MTITEFLLARIEEDEAQAHMSAKMPDYNPKLDADLEIERWCVDCDAGNMITIHASRVLAECAAKRAIIEQHKDWPVLVEKKPEFSEYATDIQSMTMRVSQEMAWLTEREYVKRFGVEAPTTNMILALAAVYASHPDYRQEWAL